MDIEKAAADLRARADQILRELETILVHERMTPAERQAAAARADAELLRDAGALAGRPEPAAEQACNQSAVVYRRLAMLESWTERRPLRGPAWLDTAAGFAATDALRSTIAAERPKLEELSLFGDVFPLLTEADRAGQDAEAAARAVVAAEKAASEADAGVQKTQAAGAEKAKADAFKPSVDAARPRYEKIRAKYVKLKPSRA